MKTIAVFPNPKKEIDFHTVRELFALLAANGCRTLMREEYRELTAEFAGIVYCGAEAMRGALAETDMILVLGGDGSILEASRTAAIEGVPILGVNFGRIGYMAELEIHELEMIARIIRDEVRVKTEERMMLDVSILRGDARIYESGPSLNDAVVSNGPVSRLLSLEVYCDGERAGRYRADGIIIATPTGSTAYSMSAGGPVLDPCLDCLCATPICSHSLTSRPVIFKGDSVLELRYMMCRDNRKYLTVDGRESVRLLDGDVVRIQRSAYRTRLLRVKDGGFLSVLRRKMSEA